MINLNTNTNYDTDEEYQAVYLNVFSLTTFDEIKINKYIADLKNKLILNNKFRNLFKKAAGLYISEDLELGLMIMFSYDYLKDFIDCLKSFNETNDTSKVDELIKKIKK